MSRKARKRPQGAADSIPDVMESGPIAKTSRKRVYSLSLGFFCFVCALSAVSLTKSGNITLTHTKTLSPRTLDELLALPESDLVKVDFALMNLLCAEGLPGSEKLDIQACLDALDKWAEYCTPETLRHMYKFKKAPQEYENSEGFFRILFLNTVLQQDFGVHYNLERVTAVDFRNSKDLFIHGMLNDANGGTCASMPIILTAVARRMGYPVKLVSTKAHLFCRWEMPGDRINLESSCVGLNTYKDEYYKKWPLEIGDGEIKRENFLVSMSPRQELATFLTARGHCLFDNNRLKEAEAAYAAAVRLSPENAHYRGFLALAQNKQRLGTTSKTSELASINAMLVDMRRDRIKAAEINQKFFNPNGRAIPQAIDRMSPHPLNYPNNQVSPIMTPDMWGHLPKPASLPKGKQS